MDLVIYQVMELEVVHVSDRDRAVKRLAGPAVTELDLAVGRDGNAFPEFPVAAVAVQVIQDLRLKDIGIFLRELLPLSVDIVVGHDQGILDVCLACSVKVGSRDIKSESFRRQRQVDLQDLSDIHT